MDHLYNRVAKTFSLPFPFGGGWVVEERRFNNVFRSSILPTKAAALAYRKEAIEEEMRKLAELNRGLRKSGNDLRA